jgi:hypothetical protein
MKVVYSNQLHVKFQVDWSSVIWQGYAFCIDNLLQDEFNGQSGITPDKICIYHGVALISNHKKDISAGLNLTAFLLLKLLVRMHKYILFGMRIIDVYSK